MMYQGQALTQRAADARRGAASMTERVMLYSSRPITLEELSPLIRALGGSVVTPDSNEYRVLGSIEQGERYIIVSGNPVPPQSTTDFWEEDKFDDEKLSNEIVSKLGARPRASFHIEIGYGPKSGLLAVELAYQCALRWPCVVFAEEAIGAERKDGWIAKIHTQEIVYTKEDMESLRSEGKAFTSYGMLD